MIFLDFQLFYFHYIYVVQFSDSPHKPRPSSPVTVENNLPIPASLCTWHSFGDVLRIKDAGGKLNLTPLPQFLK